MATKKKAAKKRAAKPFVEIVIQSDGSVVPDPAHISKTRHGGAYWRAVDPTQVYAINFPGGPFGDSIVNDAGNGKTKKLRLRRSVSPGDQFLYDTATPSSLVRGQFRIDSGGGIIVDA